MEGERDMKKLFSIGEAAQFAKITRRIILNYETHELITPDVKDGPSGNRYYTIDTLTKIRTIRSLQNLGLSLDEIRDYFNNSSDLLPIVRRLEALRDELNLNIKMLYERIDRGFNQVEEVTMPEQTIYCRTEYAETVVEKTNLLRDTALEAMHAYDTSSAKCIYFTECPIDNPKKVTFCVVMPAESEGNNIVTLPATRAICLYYHGAYEGIPASHHILIAYAQQKSLEPTGVFRHNFLEGPPQHKDKSKYFTQIILPIK